ncbi:MAG: VWA domain-containing protein, partial [Candidatus Brocadiia bacterium]
LGGRGAPRLEAAVRFADRFIGRRDGDRIGIVVFGARAATQCPLTFDRQVARQLLSYAQPEMLGKRTALGDGVALAVARLAEGGALVLLSDGGQTAGRTTPLEAARAAAARGVTIHAVGVGSEGPVPVPARMPSGRTKLVTKDYPLREEALRALAETTGGSYLRADDTAALGRAFGTFDELEKKPREALETVPRTRLADTSALAAAIALGALMLGSSTVFQTAPRLR